MGLRGGSRALEIRKGFSLEPASPHNSSGTPKSESRAKRGNAQAQEGSQREKGQPMRFLQEPPRAPVGSKKKRHCNATTWELPSRYRCCATCCLSSQRPSKSRCQI